MSKRTISSGKTPFAREQHDRRDRAERLGKPGSVYDVPDRARPSKSTEHVDPYENPTYYSSSSGQRIPESPIQDTDITITDYVPKAQDIDEDMSSHTPLMFGKPGQFEEITTWCEIAFKLNDEMAQDKSKQAAYFAKTFRGPVLTWLAKQDDTETLLMNYTLLKERCKTTWTQSDQVKRANAARKIQTLVQKKNAAGYSREFEELTEILGWSEDVKLVTYPRGLKQQTREGLITGGPWDTYKAMKGRSGTTRLRIYSIRATEAHTETAAEAPRRFSANVIRAPIRHKARDCRKQWR
uniref:ORF1 n=1 Tax=Penicillium waksmanii metavirus 1 TaxID=1755796 RepID=A0A0S2KPW8_9VIRU|nr:ORF1 [Penicillium waksmanii metavirus 1]